MHIKTEFNTIAHTQTRWQRTRSNLAWNKSVSYEKYQRL